MLLTEGSVESFLDQLASSEPTPGGGSVAALAGALGAALVSMVCNLTLGKKGYEAIQTDLSLMVAKSEDLRGKLVGLISDDVTAFSAYSTASKMPRNSPEERTARTETVQSALKGATAVPLGIARTAAQVMALCRPCAEKGNKWAVSDAGVAVLLAEAAVKSAALNVLINLSVLKDQQFIADTQAELDEILSSIDGVCSEVYDLVRGML